MRAQSQPRPDLQQQRSPRWYWTGITHCAANLIGAVAQHCLQVRPTRPGCGTYLCVSQSSFDPTLDCKADRLADMLHLPLTTHAATKKIEEVKLQGSLAHIRLCRPSHWISQRPTSGISSSREASTERAADSTYQCSPQSLNDDGLYFIGDP